MCSGSQKQNMPPPHLSIIITDSEGTFAPPSTSSITFMEKITLPICALKQDFKYIAVLKNTTHQFKQLLRKSRFLCLNSLIYLRFYHPSGATITSMIFFQTLRCCFHNLKKFQLWNSEKISALKLKIVSMCQIESEITWMSGCVFLSCVCVCFAARWKCSGLRFFVL